MTIANNNNNALRGAALSFRRDSTMSLLMWWFQYGRPDQAGFYPSAPRRAARREFKRRGINPPKEGVSPIEYWRGDGAWPALRRLPPTVEISL